jgi:predicted dehydrogenase
MWVQIGTHPGAATEEIRFDVCDQYALQTDAFARAIIEDKPVPTPLADAVANMRVIERITASAEKGVWT